MIADFKKDMMKRYKVNNMGLLHHFLCMEIYEYDDGFFICQKKYAENILVKFDIADCKPMTTALLVSEKLVKGDGETKVDTILYRNLVENLLHLTTIMLDIMFTVTLLSRFMHNPSQLHLGATKRVLRSINGTLNNGLNFGKGAITNLNDYCDSDWGEFLVDMKSTSSYCFSLVS